MNKLIFSMAAATVLLSGCIAVPYNAGAGAGYHRSHDQGPPAQPGRVYRDPDRDGVPNRHDRAPGNPYRY
jgi:hypothetical protein